MLAAVALERVAGTAMSGDTIKLSARQVLALPLPPEGEQWNEGAGLARTASSASTESAWNAALDELGLVMCGAYGLDEAATDQAFRWWQQRRPAWR